MPIETDTGTKLTYEDYVKIPADGKRHEIIEGNHIVNPAPHPDHQSIQFRASRQFGVLEDERRARVYCAPIDVRLSDTDIVQPDIIAVDPPYRSGIEAGAVRVCAGSRVLDHRSG